jgi:hypothetical protein
MECCRVVQSFLQGLQQAITTNINNEPRFSFGCNRIHWYTQIIQHHHFDPDVNDLSGLPVALAFERSGYNVSGSSRSKEKAAVLLQNESM